MSEWSDSHLQLAGHRVFLVLLPFLIAFVYWVYQRTYPQVDPKRRMALVVLRGAAVALLAMVLCEPVLTWWHQQVIRPLVLVLVDTSPSMRGTEGSVTRLQQAVAVLSDEGWSARLQQAEVRAWGFAESAYPLALDTVAVASTRGQATDIGRAVATSLEAVAERERVQGVVLFSDGGHNLGRDPVRLSAELDVPVYALGVGGAEVPVDVQLVDVRTTETGYVGQRQQIDAEVRSWGYEGKRVEVRLYEGDRSLQRQSLLLEGDGQVQRVSFAMTPQQAGPRIFRVVVDPAAGEFATADNEALAFTRILAGRPRVLLLAGGPSEDLAFLRRSLSADSSWVVETLIQREPDAFYGGAWSPAVLQDRDVILLVNPGAWLLNSSPATALVQHVHAGAGLLIVGGPKMARAWQPDSPLAALMPLQVAGPVPFVPGEILLRLSPAGRHHPVVRQPAGVDDPWLRLPPLPGYFRTAQQRPGTSVLVESVGGEPVIAAGAYGKGKVIAALSASFWRLDLMSSGVDGQPQTIRTFWCDAAKWLALDAPGGRVRASTERPVYRAGEEVVFEVQVFDELLRPQPGASVRVALAGREAFDLQSQGAGRYRGVASGLAPGTYEYEVRAAVDQAVVGAVMGRFVVEEYSIELGDLRADPLLLGELARASGGRAYPLAAWEDMLEQLAPRKRWVEEAEVLPLWGPLWPALLAVALLAAEWFGRKRSGMI